MEVRLHRLHRKKPITSWDNYRLDNSKNLFTEQDISIALFLKLMLPCQVPGRRSRCPCLEACPPPTPMCCGPPAPVVANVNRRKWGHYSGSDKQIFLLPQVCHVRSQAIATHHSHSGSVPLDIWYFFALLDMIRIEQNRLSICAKMASYQPWWTLDI